MLDDPSITKAIENEPVTAIISHVIRPGRTQGYEEWLRGIIAAAKQSDGHMGVSIIQPQDHAHPEYVAILRFDQYSNLKKWLESEVRRDWIERLQPLIEKPEAVQTLTGLETWFSLPEKPLKSPPPRYKMFCATWLGVEIMTILIRTLIAPLFASLPWLVGLTISNAIVVACLTYFIMPHLTRLLYPWLYPKSVEIHD
jgi:antibiotic biosynthesis monooxygenase (ABM) superfamily enzyme